MKILGNPHFQVFDVTFCCWCCWVFFATWSHHFVASRETPWFTLPKFWQQRAGTCCRCWRRAPQNSKGGGKLYHRKDQTEKSQVSLSVIKWNEVCFFCDRLRTVKLAVNDQGGSFCVQILQKLQWNTQMLSKLYVNILHRKYYPRYQICIYIYKHFPNSSQMLKQKTTLKKEGPHYPWPVMFSVRGKTETDETWRYTYPGKSLATNIQKWLAWRVETMFDYVRVYHHL